MDIDRYHRMVAVLYLGDRDINREVVQEGYAWAYREYLYGPYASRVYRRRERCQEQAFRAVAGQSVATVGV